MSTTPGPTTDAEIRPYLQALGLPGLVDVHVHFMPDPVQQAVWRYFDGLGHKLGMPWPLQYRHDEARRIEILSELGLLAIPALTYPHRSGMARGLNAWCAQFAARVPDAVHSATLFPEPDVADYVLEAVLGGARLFKLHAEVGGFTLDDPRLAPAWEILAAHRVPVVAHGTTGVESRGAGPVDIANVLARHEGLRLVIAHLGMPDYHACADLAEKYPDVMLDTALAATDFAVRMAPAPTDYVERLGPLRDQIVLGSDFPVIAHPYAHQLRALADLGLGDDWMRAVLWRNGARLLGLPRE
ncbi:amidohydrolase family protein [Spongisporangium articulatum]|uniref:Amidohydrolase family protein n=1 Tax=Spongisporangium articulatum TaxID=3362603 RepID=A0ABW8AU54_9ACTN